MRFHVASVLFVWFIGGQSCARRSQPPIMEITVERKGCLGPCPVYKLSLRKNSTSTYHGVKFVERIGQYSAKKSPAVDFDRISRAVSDLRFFDLDNDYAAGWIDSERVIVTVVRPSESKTVRSFYFSKAPFELWAVVTLADGIAANLQWVKQ